MKKLISITLIFSLLFPAISSAKIEMICREIVRDGNYFSSGSLNSKEISDKTFRFEKIKWDLKNELSKSNISDRKVKCLKDLYSDALNQSSAYWSMRALKEGCVLEDSTKVPSIKPQICSKKTWDEFMNSRNYLNFHNSQFLKLADEINEKTQSDYQKLVGCKNPPFSQGNLAAVEEAIQTSKEILCCGNAKEKNSKGIVKIIYPDLNRNTCLDKVQGNSQIDFYDGASGCVSHVVDSILSTMMLKPGKVWNQVSQLFSLGTFSAIKEILTQPEARKNFGKKLFLGISDFFQSRGDVISQCLNGYSKTMYYCEVAGETLGVALDIIIIGKLLMFMKAGNLSTGIANLLLKSKKVISVKVPIKERIKAFNKPKSKTAGDFEQEDMRVLVDKLEERIRDSIKNNP
jgi:hypothetical protein